MKTTGRVMPPLSAHHLYTFHKGHNSNKIVGGVTVLVLCTSPDNALYLSQVLRKYLKGSL